MLITSSEDESPSTLSNPAIGQVVNLPRDGRDGKGSALTDRFAASRRENKIPATSRTTLRSMSPAAQFAYGHHAAQPILRQIIAPLDGLEALRQAATRQAVQASLLEAQGGAAKTNLRSSEPVSSHAAPLSPLRERDIQALSAWFDREDMTTIETDVDRCLLVLWPAPCWEDDPFEFLQEFL